MEKPEPRLVAGSRSGAPTWMTKGDLARVCKILRRVSFHGGKALGIAFSDLRFEKEDCLCDCQLGLMLGCVGVRIELQA